MTNDELNCRLAAGFVPVERHLDDNKLWVTIPPDTIRVAAPPHTGFVQVINHEIVAVWESQEVRWLAPESLVVLGQKEES